MSNAARLAVAGVGNNLLALCQGVSYYGWSSSKEGIRHHEIGGMTPADVAFVAAFDVDPDKVGKPLREAVFAGTNNYPDLHQDLTDYSVIVDQGLTGGAVAEGEQEVDRLVERLEQAEAEVLLYSLPTGLQWAATAYAKAACRAGVAFVNCTPEVVGRSDGVLSLFESRSLPLLGDDLASQIGTSVIHRELLRLLADRGICLESSYQLNLGGNADFRNLREHGASKRQSKIDALSQADVDTSNVEVIPSAGFVSHLRDNKVAYVNIEGRGWAGTQVSIDLKLKVQDSSNAAGVIIDLVRIAASAKRLALGGYVPAATPALKSPPGGPLRYSARDVRASLNQLNGQPTPTSTDVVRFDRSPS